MNEIYVLSASVISIINAIMSASPSENGRPENLLLDLVEEHLQAIFDTWS